jgi:hypothetical protein
LRGRCHNPSATPHPAWQPLTRLHTIRTQTFNHFIFFKYRGRAGCHRIFLYYYHINFEGLRPIWRMLHQMHTGVQKIRAGHRTRTISPSTVQQATLASKPLLCSAAQPFPPPFTGDKMAAPDRRMMFACSFCGVPGSNRTYSAQTVRNTNRCAVTRMQNKTPAQGRGFVFVKLFRQAARRPNGAPRAAVRTTCNSARS